MRKVFAVAVTLLLSLPVAARAQLSLGARLGYAPAMGNAMKDPDTGEKAKMSEMVKGQLPLQLDVAYRITPAIAVGGYVSYGFLALSGDLKDACDAGTVDCSASDLRLGVQASYAFTGVSPKFIPWLGLGAGYEWTKLKLSGPGGEVSLTYKGWELVNLQVGGDFQLARFFALGPYAMLSVAQYGRAEMDLGSSSSGADVDKKAVHEWLHFGIRGKFDL